MQVRKVSSLRTGQVLLALLLAFFLVSAPVLLPFDGTVVRAEEGEEPPAEEPPAEEGEETELPSVPEDYNLPAPEFTALVTVDWSQWGDADKPASVNVTIIPDNNHLYATSFTLSADTDWAYNYEMPAGTETAYFSLEGNYNYQVNTDADNNFILVMLPAEAQADPQNDLIDDININPGEEMGHIPVPTANNDVPEDAVLKIRSNEDNGDGDQNVKFEYDETKMKEAEEELAEIEAEREEGTNIWYTIAAIAAAILALGLIIVRIIYGVRDNKRKKEAQQRQLQQRRNGPRQRPPRR